jgi:hypothetical protein
MPGRPSTDIRVFDLLAALSLVTDLGAAWPAETALRTTLLGVGLAGRVGIVDPSEVYFLALLRSVACTSFAHELAMVWADDIQIRRLLDPVDKTSPEEMLGIARALEDLKTRFGVPPPPQICSRLQECRWRIRCAWPIAMWGCGSSSDWA